jgi:hypothetical protein
MATLNFDEPIVLILFAQSGGTLTPTQADIIQFDGDLQNNFGTDLQRIMTEEGLDINVHSRSLVLGCRPHMPGSTAALQIRRACRYVLSAPQAVVAAAAISFSPQLRATASTPARLVGKRAGKRGRNTKRLPARKKRKARRRP